MRWAPPAVALAVSVAAGLAACSGGSTPSGSRGQSASDVARSSTIAWGPDRSSVWLTSPDDDRVVAVGSTALEVRRSIAVEGQPQELSWSGRDLLVTGAQRTSLAVIDTSGTGHPVRAIDLPCGGTRSVVGAAVDGHRYAFVTCPNDDLVAVADVERGRAIGALSVGSRPTGIVRRGDVLSVATAGDGRVSSWSVRDLVAKLGADGGRARSAPLTLRPSSSVRAWADGERQTSTLGALDAAPRGVVGTYQVVDDLRRLSSAEVRGDPTYGTPLGGRPRIEAALFGPCGARFADVSAPARRASGPVAVAADPNGDLVWVVGEFSHSVSVVRCDGGDPSSKSPTVASFEVGDGARGIALSPDGRSAVVDVGFDHAVARLALPADASAGDAPAAKVRQRPDLVVQRKVDGYLTPLAQAGRSMFHDATDEHLTPFGLATCASCHPDAGDDGRSWRIETANIPQKLRRTQAVWGTDDRLKPLHWSGEITSTDDLVLTTIQELLGGDALLVDTAAFDAYLREVLPPPTAPTWWHGDAAKVARGAELFRSSELGCVTCHAGDAGTDGRLHSVLTASSDPAARLDAVVTPPLTGVRARAPYGHDGRAATLEDLLGEHQDGHGVTIALDADDRAALVAYLRSR